MEFQPLDQDAPDTKNWHAVMYGAMSGPRDTFSQAGPETVRGMGVAAAPEGHQVLTDLTVMENLRTAGINFTRRRLDDGIEEALSTFPELRAKLGARAGLLSAVSSK
jgi:ABC-type branched-subunit amino acid transport system ATPase component